MCIICNGYSHDDAVRRLDLVIRIHGWALQGVHPDGDDHDAEPGSHLQPSTWVYSLGLVDFGVPELIATELTAAAAGELLNTVASRITKGVSLDEACQSLGAHWVEVHENHLSSHLFAMWHELYGNRPRRVVQILPPRSWMCDCHRDAYFSLDQPDPLPNAELLRQPNRAERRAAARAQRRVRGRRA